MKTRFFGYLSVLAAALILGSCSSDIENARAVKTDANANRIITFNAWMDKQTKAAPTTINNLTSFTLSAWQKDKTLVNADDLILNAVIVARGESQGSAWTYQPLQTWPGSDSVVFYAYSPAQSTNVSQGLGTPATVPEIAYDLPGHTTASTKSVQYQEDLLVANHAGNYNSDAAGVSLNFRHALSRVLVQARNVNANKNYVITDVTLKNVVGNGKLDLSSLPADDEHFPYPTDQASLDADGYQTYWDTSGGALGDVSADLPSSGVLINYSSGTDYQSVVDGQNGLYVIPQELAANTDMPVAIQGGISATMFYLEVSYKEVLSGQALGSKITWAFPVRARVGDDKSISSIAFEIQRQYTFQLTFGEGDNPIKIGTIFVDDYDYSNGIDAIVLPRDTTIIEWAGTNIYYDDTPGVEHLTFLSRDDAGYDPATTATYQGVFFPWGSLTGIGTGVADGTVYASSMKATYPLGGTLVVNDNPASIPSLNNRASIPDPADPGRKYLIEHHNPASGVGDICKFLSDNGWAPSSGWRMPTANEFQELLTGVDYGTSGTIPGDEHGTVSIDYGIQLGDVILPAAGALNTTWETISQGTVGYYWGQSLTATGFPGLTFTSSPPTVNQSATESYPVRCVKEHRIPID